MIRRIEIDGFKCLREIDLDPASINVLVGPNASGKSSVLQALLLLRQSAGRDGSLDALHLSGELYEAGTPLDAIHPSVGYGIRIALETGDGRYDSRFIYDRDDNRALNVRRLRAENPGSLPDVLFDRNDGFAYLGAERVGPRVAYHLPFGDEGLGGRVGKNGEYTSAVLARAFNSQEKVPGWSDGATARFGTALKELDGETLVDELADSQGSLSRLSNVMLGWIVPGAEFFAEEHTQTDSTTLQFTRDIHKTKTRVRATHVGFGLPYALPVIVAGLSLRAGGICLIENPEAHLHPFSQSRIGVFMSILAAEKRQMFVETHSDHVVNGIRLAVRYGLVPANEVRLYYFSNTLVDESSKVTRIAIGSNGEVSDWPRGFFDQIERDLARI